MHAHHDAHDVRRGASSASGGSSWACACGTWTTALGPSCACRTGRRRTRASPRSRRSLEAGAVLSVRVDETHHAPAGAALADLGAFYARLHRHGLFGELELHVASWATRSERLPGAVAALRRVAFDAVPAVARA